MGIEPIQAACKAVSPPWHMRPQRSEVLPGVEPGPPPYQSGVPPETPQDQSVAEVGVEPTIDHQALDLAALPGLRTRPCSGVSPAGFEPATPTFVAWCC